jgi:hypothetical protein
MEMRYGSLFHCIQRQTRLDTEKSLSVAALESRLSQRFWCILGDGDENAVLKSMYTREICAAFHTFSQCNPGYGDAMQNIMQKGDLVV